MNLYHKNFIFFTLLIIAYPIFPMDWKHTKAALTLFKKVETKINAFEQGLNALFGLTPNTEETEEPTTPQTPNTEEFKQQIIPKIEMTKPTTPNDQSSTSNQSTKTFTENSDHLMSSIPTKPDQMNNQQSPKIPLHQSQYNFSPNKVLTNKKRQKSYCSDWIIINQDDESNNSDTSSNTNSDAESSTSEDATGSTKLPIKP